MCEWVDGCLDAAQVYEAHDAWQGSPRLGPLACIASAHLQRRVLNRGGTEGQHYDNDVGKYSDPQCVMASQPPSRASLSDRRASAQQRQQKSRPTSAVEDNNRTDSKSTFQNRVKTTTTETNKRDVLSRDILVKRTTFSPTKQQPERANGRRSEDVERPISKGKTTLRPEQDEERRKSPVRAQHCFWKTCVTERV